VHAGFAGNEASVVWVASRFADVSFSFTSHSSRYEPLLAEKVRLAAFVVAISDYERARLRQVVDPTTAERIIVCRYGVDPLVWRRSTLSGQGGDLEGGIISVGSLVDKKGHRVLIEAVRLLADRGVSVECCIVGDGPMRGRLDDLIVRLSVDDRVRLVGALPTPEVRREVERAMVFALPCVVSPTEGGDGIPVSLMEAMALEKACVSTPVAGIPELVVDGQTGLLAREGDASSLADALERLLEDRRLRATLGAAARRIVESEYNSEANAAILVRLFEQAVRAGMEMGRGDSQQSDNEAATGRARADGEQQ
jgi:glycosyltransferase involved in cell wall biosynthesis